MYYIVFPTFLVVKTTKDDLYGNENNRITLIFLIVSTISELFGYYIGKKKFLYDKKYGLFYIFIVI